MISNKIISIYRQVSEFWERESYPIPFVVSVYNNSDEIANPTHLRVSIGYLPDNDVIFKGRREGIKLPGNRAVVWGDLSSEILPRSWETFEVTAILPAHVILNSGFKLDVPITFGVRTETNLVEIELALEFLVGPR